MHELNNALDMVRGMMVRVLVFDESPLVARLVEYQLQGYGWIVESCSDGKTLLGRMEDFRPNVVLVDPLTPGLELSALLKLHSGKSINNYKVICLSNDSGCAALDLMNSGLMDGHFVKRYSLDGLADTIKNALSGCEA